MRPLYRCEGAEPRSSKAASQLMCFAQWIHGAWDVEWLFRDAASQPLLDALKAAGIRVKVGG